MYSPNFYGYGGCLVGGRYKKMLKLRCLGLEWNDNGKTKCVLHKERF